MHRRPYRVALDPFHLELDIPRCDLRVTAHGLWTLSTVALFAHHMAVVEELIQIAHLPERSVLTLLDLREQTMMHIDVQIAMQAELIRYAPMSRKVATVLPTLQPRTMQVLREPDTATSRVFERRTQALAWLTDANVRIAA